MTPKSKQQAVKFLDSLDVSIGTKNKHASKISAFFHWINNRYDEEIKNLFEGLKAKDTPPVKEKRTAYSLSQIEFLLASMSNLEIHKQ